MSAEPVEYDVSSPEDQALEEILATPVQFRLEFEEGEFAWDRAVLFMRDYAGNGETEVSSEVFSIVNTAGQPYSYKVIRTMSPQGYDFQVRCGSGTRDSVAVDQNCRNLARFIREGKLELSLLRE